MAERDPQGTGDLEDEEGGKLTGLRRQNWGRLTKECLPFLSPWVCESIFFPLRINKGLLEAHFQMLSKKLSLIKRW